MVIVSIAAISMTMVRLFHEDKSRYVKDVLAMTTQSVVREMDMLLQSSAAGALGLAYINASGDLSQAERSRSAEALFAASPEIVAVVSLGGPSGSASVVNGSDPLAAAFLEGSASMAEAELPATAPVSGLPIAQIDAAHVGEVALLRLLIPRPEPDRGLVVVFLRPDGLATLLDNQQLFRLHLLGTDRQVLLSSLSASGRPPPELRNVANARLMVSSIDAGGERVIVGHGSSQIAPVSLVVAVPQSVAALTEAPLLEQLFLVGLMLAAAAGVVGIWISRRLSRPLESLSAVAREVGAGRFDVAIGVSGRDEVGALAGALRTMIESLRDRDEKLQVANAALVQSEKMAAIGQLSAGLAHEVKNPLAGILGFTQLSKRKIDDPVSLRKNLDIIERETKRCADIIGSLMQFSRQQRSEQGSTDVNDAVNNAVLIVDHQLSLKKVRILKDLSPALPVVLGNANQLEQALINLMINAQQAMQPDGGLVTVSTACVDGQVCISVEDTGPGVPEDIRKRIFEPFFTTKKVGQGTGLGLSVTYGLIRDHGGDITVSTGRTGGARFTIALPAQPDTGCGGLAQAGKIQGSEAA
jgi:two-component system, NtrC family, sensor kinase